MMDALQPIPVLSGKARRAAVAAAVALLAALPYLAAGVGGSFIRLDDHQYVTANPQVLQGLSVSGARWALTTLHFVSWHPLTWLSHMLDVTLFGLDARGHHAMSILLHAVNAGLLFLALQRLTGAPGRSAVVAAMFGVHPLRVESVAWVSGRKDVLSGLLFMLVLLAWERYARFGGARRYLAALALFALGLAAKSMLVTIPFVLLLLDVWPLGRSLPHRNGGALRARLAILLEKVPFLVLAAAANLLTIMAHRMEDKSAYSLGMRLTNAIVSYASYLTATLWPSGLAVYYPFPTSPIPWLEVVASTFVISLLLIAALRRAYAQPFLAVGWLWFLGMLVPVIGVVMIGPFSRADRYTYLPQVGIFITAAWLVARIIPPAPRCRGVAGLLVLAVVAASGAASAVQAGYWRDSEAVFRRALAVTRENWAIENGLGTALAERGLHQEALQHYREAIRITPVFATARSNLCNSLAALGRYEEAAAECREAIRIAPDFAAARRNLGVALAALQRHEEAVVQYREAIRVDPSVADAYSDLGISLASLGRDEEAAASFREAIRLTPDHAVARAGLSWLARRPGSRRH